jgi:hypothetical protein
MIKKYDDKQNAKGIYILFVVAQMLLLAVMYTIVYAAFIATRLAIEKYSLNAVTAYAPTVIVFVAVPFLLYRTRNIFLQGRMLEAVIWMMGLLSIFLVGMMMHVNNISGL